MTLILAAMNRHFVVQVTDRRLTSGKKVVDEEHEKCFSLTLPGFRLSVAFTGLATVAKHTTKIWLMEQLGELARSTQEPIALLNALAEKLTERFSTLPAIRSLQASQKVLTISIVGFNLSRIPPVGVAAEVSNSPAPGEPFRVRFMSLRDDAPEDWTWVGVFGSGGLAARGFEDRIRERIEVGAPAWGVRDMLEAMVRRSADDPRSAETVGKQLDSIILHSDASKPIEGGGSTMVNQTTARMPSTVLINPDGSALLVTDFQIEDMSDEPSAMVVPKVHRNAPCPCKSGERYKNCHGKRELKRSAPVLPGLPGSAVPYRG